MYCLCTNEVALIEVSFIKSNSGFFYSSNVDVSDENSLGIMMIRMNSISVVCKTNSVFIHVTSVVLIPQSKHFQSVLLNLLRRKSIVGGKGSQM